MNDEQRFATMNDAITFSTIHSAMTDFHFLRPEWLWALLPLLLLAWWLWRIDWRRDAWAAHVDAHLLNYLRLSSPTKNRGCWWLLGCLAAMLCIVGVAGPTWGKIQTPTFHRAEPTVFVLSLTQSMNATDIKPSRLKRAVHKIRDMLKATQGGARALVIYSDRPFIATPLTDDAHVIEQFLPPLSTQLMPVLGRRLDLALDEALGLLQRGQAVRGHIIVLTDGEGLKSSETSAKNIRRAGYRLSILGMGTAKGAPLQTAEGWLIRKGGRIVTTCLASQSLAHLARLGGGQFVKFRTDNRDITQLLDAKHQPVAGKKMPTEADIWEDRGFWLLLLPLLILALAFRRGVLFVLVVSMGNQLIAATPVVSLLEWF